MANGRICIFKCAIIPKKLQEWGTTWEKVKKEGIWSELPIIEKDEVVKDIDKMISEEYIAEVSMEQLIHTHTSGSTGTFLDIYWKNEDLLHALLPLWVDRWETAGIHPKDRVCQFNTTLRDNKIYAIEGNKMIVSKDRLSIEYFEEIYRIITDFEPKWMILHPATAALLLDNIRSKRLPALESVQYVELTGEMALDGLKRDIESLLGCVVKMHYGTMEVQSIGYQEGTRYRMYEQTTHVEVLDDEGHEVEEGEQGNIYVTSLHNHTMPFVRYGIGDVGCIQYGQQNGNLVRYLVLQNARKNDRIILEKGERIPADVLLKPIEMVNGYYQNVIYQFQAIQKSLFEIDIQIVMDEEFGRGKLISIYNDVIRETIVGNMKFNFNFLDCICPGKNTGKICWFESRISQ